MADHKSGEQLDMEYAQKHAGPDYNWFLDEKVKVTLVSYDDQGHWPVYLVEAVNAQIRFAVLSHDPSGNDGVLTNGQRIGYDERIWGLMDEIAETGLLLGMSYETGPYTED